MVVLKIFVLVIGEVMVTVVLGCTVVVVGDVVNLLVEVPVGVVIVVAVVVVVVTVVVGPALGIVLFSDERVIMQYINGGTGGASERPLGNHPEWKLWRSS